MAYTESARVRQRSDAVGSGVSGLKSAQAAHEAKMQSWMAFSSSVLNMGVIIAKILIIKKIGDSYQNPLSRMMLFRRSVVSSYAMAETGNYVYRPVRVMSFSGGGEKDDFTALTIIHLPTGQHRTTVLSPTYLNYGIWNLADLEKEVVYHHGIGLDPEYYKFSDPINLSSYGKRRTINTFLIAAPLKVPK